MVLKVKGKSTVEISRPGVYTSRSGEQAIIMLRGFAGRWIGRLPDTVLNTWWGYDGRHAANSLHDVVAVQDVKEYGLRF